MRGPLVVVLAVLAAAAAPAGRAPIDQVRLATPAAPSAPPPSLKELLDAYWQGDFEVVRRRFSTGDDVVAIVPGVRASIATTAVRGWEEGALVLILDLADAALRSAKPNPRAATQLVMLGYEEITRKRSRDDGEDEIDRAFESRWHETAVGILEGAKDFSRVLDYVKRVEPRYDIGLPARLWLARGFARSASEQNDAVVAMFDRAARDPGLRAEASARAASVLIRMQRGRDALRRLDLAGDPGADLAVAAWLPYLRGLALLSINEPQEALTAFDQAIALNPESLTVRQMRGVALERLGRKADPDDKRPDGGNVWAPLADADYRFVPSRLATLKADLRTASSSPAPRRAALLELLDRYEGGDHRAVVEELQSAGSLETLSVSLSESADAWFKEAAPDARPRRELVAATLALEAAHARGYAEWPRAQLIVEWACERLRARLAPTDGERAWMRAAAVLMEGVVQGAALEVHVTHALKRFPDDPSLTMARAVAVELRAGPDLRSGGGLESPPAGTLELLIHRLEQAAAMPAYRDEAQLRLGYTALRQRRFKDALELLAPVTSSEDSFLRYLAHLFRGRALDGQKQFADAVTEYQRAGEAAPGAQTAEIALATALARAGRRADAAALAEASLTRAGAAFDPWLAYGQGELRKWPEIIAAVREATQ